MGLSGFEDKYPHQLSGGMRQRTGLARALTVNSDILLMDEPTKGIDVGTCRLPWRRLSSNYSKNLISDLNKIITI